MNKDKKLSAESVIAIASINKWLEEDACQDVDGMGYVVNKTYVVDAEEIYQSVQSLLSAKIKEQKEIDYHVIRSLIIVAREIQLNFNVETHEKTIKWAEKHMSPEPL